MGVRVNLKEIFFLEETNHQSQPTPHPSLDQSMWNNFGVRDSVIFVDLNY